jgi:hypothetical protein
MSKQMTPLRRRMIDDMKIRNLSPSTQNIYVRAVLNFSIFHGRSPDKLTFEDVCDYRLHLISRRLKATTINPIMGALRFFYGTTLGQKQVTIHGQHSTSRTIRRYGITSASVLVPMQRPSCASYQSG